jgi:hypothetical protein
MAWNWQQPDWPEFEALKASAIEDEVLDRDSVQSSLRQLNKL